MRPHIFRVVDRRGAWYVVHDGKRVAETALGEPEDGARRAWERAHGVPPEGYAWVKGDFATVAAVAAAVAAAVDRAGEAVRLVPLADLVALARLGLVMRKAQAAYFAARRAKPYSAADSELRAAKHAEDRFDAEARAVMRREQGELPGMRD